MGSQKSRLNETVLLSSQNIMLKLMDKKIFIILCLSKPMIIGYLKEHKQMEEQTTKVVSGWKRVNLQFCAENVDLPD